MKILHLAPTLAPVGGTEIYLRSLLNPLADRGHENLLVTLQGDPEDSAGGFAHFTLGEHPAERLAEMILAENPDIAYLNGVLPTICIETVARMLPAVAYIHDFHPVCPGLAKYFRASEAVCSRAAGWGCIPYIYFQRCASARNPANVTGIIRLTQARLAAYDRLSRLLVASRYMAGLLIQNGLDKRRIGVLPQFTTAAGEPAPLYAEAAPSVLFAGRLEPEKGLTDLLEALALVHADWRLEVAGDGTDRQRHEQTVRERGWSDRVRFHGWLDGAALARLYGGARLVAMPSTWPEPFGRVGLDALAYGRPVVAYNVGGISSWLEDGRSGYLVAPHDRSALASRIEALLDDPELAAGFGRYGARIALERFGAGGHIEALIEILESTLSQPA